MTLPWEEVGDLHAVRALGELLGRRFGVTLAIRSTAIRSTGGTIRAIGPRQEEPAELLKETLTRQGAPLGGDGAPLRSAVAPICDGAGEPIGEVTAGLYLRSGVEPPGKIPSEVLAILPRLSAAEDDFVLDLVRAVAAEIELYARGRSASAASGGRSSRYSYASIIGESQPMRKLYRLLDRVIDSDSTVLVEGENGTGKDLIAREIHGSSARRAGAYVAQNCAAFNDELLCSELFGHRRGAFTGAISDKRGLFEVADRGTFFLDEVGEMSPSLQVKLLRVLQEGTFIPVGDTEPKQVDVRIIAATNQDLKALMEQGRFREDLYYRLNVINIVAPPLRERREDIPLLAKHFLARQGGEDAARRLTRACLERLLGYSWPGNVRELENEIERMVVLAEGAEVIGVELLSERILKPRATAAGPPGSTTALPAALENLERDLISRVLERHGGNKTRAARELQISRRNLIRKVQKYGIE